MRKAVFALVALVAVLAPRAALACAVCFGASDAPMAKATNLGIFMMLFVVVGMLASFAAFFVTRSYACRGPIRQAKSVANCDRHAIVTVAERASIRPPARDAEDSGWM